MDFGSADFCAYCVHSLDLLFVTLVGFCSEVVHCPRLDNGMQVTGLLVGYLVQSMSVTIPAWLLATSLKLGRAEPQAVQ